MVCVCCIYMCFSHLPWHWNPCLPKPLWRQRTGWTCDDMHTHAHWHTCTCTWVLVLHWTSNAVCHRCAGLRSATIKRTKPTTNAGYWHNTRPRCHGRVTGFMVHGEVAVSKLLTFPVIPILRCELDPRECKNASGGVQHKATLWVFYHFNWSVFYRIKIYGVQWEKKTHFRAVNRETVIIVHRPMPFLNDGVLCFL